MQPFNPTQRAETWQPVYGWDGWYEVSDLGQVRSLDRESVDRTGRPWRRRGKALKLSSRGGYPAVTLQRQGHRKTYPVHQLVLEAFDRPRPDGMECRHGPNGPTDNRWPEAICWGTRSDNHRLDRVRDGTSCRGEGSHTARLTEAVVLDCRRRAAQGELVALLAAEFGVTSGTMSHAITGRSWSYLPGAVTVGHPMGAGHPQAKLTEDIVRDCRRRRAQGATITGLASEHDVTFAAMANAITGRTWRHVQLAHSI